MTRAGRRKVLVIGYGNPGRRDDGLGPTAAAAIEKMRLRDVTVDSDYQLTVEDAHAVARCDVAVFVDADASGPEPFSFRRIAPSDYASFSSHSVEPDVVLGLARSLFKAEPDGYVLGIRGYEFNEFGEALSKGARENLDEAVRFLRETIVTGIFEERPAGVEAGRIC